MTRPRRLTPTRRLALADYLTAMATQLRADHAAAVQDLLMAAADTCWPTGTGGARANSADPSTPVERAALGRLDSTATSARWLLGWLNTMADEAPRAHALILECTPGRAVAMCPFGHPLTAAGTRCTHTDPDTGLRCGARPATVRTCSDCLKPEGRQPDGSRVTIRPWKLPNGGLLDVCNSDWMFRSRNGGRPRASVARLARDAGELVAADGTFTSD